MNGRKGHPVTRSQIPSLPAYPSELPSVLGVREDPFPRLPLQLRIERLYGIRGVHGLTDLHREIIVCEYVVVRKIQHPGHAAVYRGP